MFSSSKFWILIILAVAGLGYGAYHLKTTEDAAQAALQANTARLAEMDAALAQRRQVLENMDKTGREIRDAVGRSQELSKNKAVLLEKQNKIGTDFQTVVDSMTATVEKLRSSAPGSEIGTLSLANGKMLSGVKIRKVSEEGIALTHSDGIGTVAVDLLPEDLKEKYDLGPNAFAPKLAAAKVALMAELHKNDAAINSPMPGNMSPAATEQNPGSPLAAVVTPKLEVTEAGGTKTYANVRFMGVSDQGVRVSHDAGISVLPVASLPETWRAKFIPNTSGPPMTVPSSGSATAGSTASRSTPAQSSFDPNSLVFIKTDSGAGSGFIAKVNDKTYVYTNAHVICGTPGGFTKKIVSIKTAAGRAIPIPYDLELSNMYDASSSNGLEDMARFAITLKEGETAYDLGGLNSDTSMNQKVVAYGNSLGGDVITSLDGDIVGLGTDRIEISCGIVAGNSGGPVVMADTKKVIGISTYLSTGKRDIWTSGTAFSQVRRFALRPEKVTKWRKMLYTSLMSSLAELKAFDRDTLSLAAACYLNPRPNRGGFDVPSQQNGDYVIRQVLVDGGSLTLGSTINAGIARVNQRLGGATATMSVSSVVPIFAEFFSSVTNASASQMSSLQIADRAPYLKQFIPELIAIRKEIHERFIQEGLTRYR
ncbi:serine protease [Prosthecobacter sp.]|uniref:S1 family peptidase n=1 Tax=Prosthecobacter sp. TaxID=1965333 RepID=UPI001DDE4F7F|nr:serine protease [Prosthecobacter sp.]MCB1278376.1 trypsin-like peptidase domain-containing protein [Prosthecobacter sp.]